MDVLDASLDELGGALPTPLKVINLGAAIAIVAGRIFWVKSRVVTSQDFRRSLEDYQNSGKMDQVRTAVADAFTGVRSFDTRQHRQTLLQIVLNNRLPSGDVPQEST